jgi:hypothetical protein
VVADERLTDLDAVHTFTVTIGDIDNPTPLARHGHSFDHTCTGRPVRARASERGGLRSHRSGDEPGRSPGWRAATPAAVAHGPTGSSPRTSTPSVSVRPPTNARRIEFIRSMSRRRTALAMSPQGKPR